MSFAFDGADTPQRSVICSPALTTVVWRIAISTRQHSSAPMPAMVAPLGRRSRPSTRACFEFARVRRRPIILWGAAFARTFAADRVFTARLRLLVDIPKPLSSGAAQQRAATTQTPRRPNGAGGGEDRAGQARATMHAPFERQVERKMTPGEGLFSLRLPKFESYQPGMLNSPAAILRQPMCAQHQAKSLPQLHLGNAAARTRTVSAPPFRVKSAEIPPQHRRTSIPTDSAVRVRPPQPRSR